MLRALVVSLALLVCTTLSTSTFAAESESVPQRINKARAVTEDIEVRVNAITSLVSITADDENNHKVIDALVDLVKNSTDLFVRIAAIETLGSIQANTIHEARAKYLDTLIAILKNKDEHVNARMAAADVFRKTLEKGRVADNDQVFKPIIVPIATTKSEPADLRVICIAIVGDYGKADHVSTLADLLAEESTQIRSAAVSGIMSLILKASDAQIAPGVVARLIDVLKDEKSGLPLRIATMKLLAQLIRDGNANVERNVQPLIVKFAENGNDDALVLAAVESIGIIASDSVPTLKKVYAAYFDPKNIDNAKDVPVRKAVMKAVRCILAHQVELRSPDMTTVKGAVAIAVDAIDNDSNVDVKAAAVFALRYLYPKRFESEQKDACLPLIALMGSVKDPALQKKINDTLQFITGARPGSEHDQWIEYVDTRWPRPNAKRPQ